jgi:hypothetical protein
MLINDDVIYEYSNDKLYGRKFGSSERFLICDYIDEHTKDMKLWQEILQASRSNDVLKYELDRVKIFYLLNKHNDER